ncbi:peptidase S8/S53 domain-containing protein [Apiospora phragmitis]|uniref:Peptidase S8/S53 domain-containing protein n=1 Tax=Apiospora phragmitis TaxID=2905665 RepID=A0ABR1VQE1_9PEZI
MGVASSLYENKHVFQKSYPVCFGGANWKDIDEDSMYNFNSKAESFNYFKVSSMLDWGVHELRWDVFDSDWDESKWTYPPTAANGLVGPVARWAGAYSNLPSLDLTDPAVIKANTLDTPVRSLSCNGFASCNDYLYRWTGHLTNGTGA